MNDTIQLGDTVMIAESEQLFVVKKIDHRFGTATVVTKSGHKFSFGMSKMAVVTKAGY